MAIAPLKIIYAVSLFAFSSTVSGVTIVYSIPKNDFKVDKSAFKEDAQIIQDLQFTSEGVPLYSWANDWEFKEKDIDRYEHTIENIYSYLLLSPNFNRDTWNSNYEKLNNSNSSWRGIVTKGYDSSDASSLNNNCKKLYETKIDYIFWNWKKLVNGNNESFLYQNKLNQDNIKGLWKYCSFIGDEAESLSLDSELNPSSISPISKLQEIFWPTTENFKTIWAVKQFWYDTIGKYDKWDRDDFLNFIRNNSELDENNVSIRKFCSLATEQYTYQFSWSKSRILLNEQPLNLRTLYRYCSAVDWNADINIDFNKSGSRLVYRTITVPTQTEINDNKFIVISETQTLEDESVIINEENSEAE